MLIQATIPVGRCRYLHAGGSHDHSDVIVDVNGRVEIIKESSLYPWTRYPTKRLVSGLGHTCRRRTAT